VKDFRPTDGYAQVCLTTPIEHDEPAYVSMSYSGISWSATVFSNALEAIANGTPVLTTSIPSNDPNGTYMLTACGCTLTLVVQNADATASAGTGVLQSGTATASGYVSRALLASSNIRCDVEATCSGAEAF